MHLGSSSSKDIFHHRRSVEEALVSRFCIGFVSCCYKYKMRKPEFRLAIDRSHESVVLSEHKHKRHTFVDSRGIIQNRFIT